MRPVHRTGFAPGSKVRCATRWRITFVTGVFSMMNMPLDVRTCERKPPPVAVSTTVDASSSGSASLTSSSHSAAVRKSCSTKMRGCHDNTSRPTSCKRRLSCSARVSGDESATQAPAIRGSARTRSTATSGWLCCSLLSTSNVEAPESWRESGDATSSLCACGTHTRQRCRRAALLRRAHSNAACVRRRPAAGPSASGASQRTITTDGRSDASRLNTAIVSWQHCSGCDAAPTRAGKGATI